MASSSRRGSTQWKETRHDKFYHLAKEQGYRSRAAFKLIQLNKKYDFLSSAKSVVDLGAAPGGWLQVAQKYMPVSSLIIGVDLLPIRPIRGVTTIQQDITTEGCKKAIKQELQSWDVDVVMHDGAPNVSGGGNWSRDAYIQNELVVHSLRLATTVLRPGGWFVTKIFRSQDYNSLLWVLQQFFKKVEVTKPQASRNASAEIFVVCQGYLAPKKIDSKLLDPNSIFQQWTEEEGKKKVDVFQKKEGSKSHRSRAGYEDVSNMTQTKVLSMVDWVSTDLDTTEAIEALGSYNTLSFEPAPTISTTSHGEVKSAEQRARHDALLQLLLNHAATTEEIRELSQDLKVLGKGDFKSLLKYRKKIQLHLKELDEEEKKKDGRWEQEELERQEREARKAAEYAAAHPQLSPEEQFEQDLRELRMKKQLEAKKDRKKRRELKAKLAKRLLVNKHNLVEQSELIGEGENAASAGHAGTTGAHLGEDGGEEGLFSLKSIKTREALEAVAETEGKDKLSKKKKRKANEEEEEDESEDDDDMSDLSDEGDLYARILAENELEYQVASGQSKASKGRLPFRPGMPLNEYEDLEHLKMEQLRRQREKERELRLDNLRGDEDSADEESYYNRLEKDLDFMYETYRNRREIKTKNRISSSMLLMPDETDGGKVLEEARMEERRRRREEAKKRKERGEESDEDDMDRFNSSSSSESEEEDEGTSRKRKRAASSDSDEADEDDPDSHPLLRPLASESKPSTMQRMNRWFNRGLLGELAEQTTESREDTIEVEKDDEDEEDDEMEVDEEEDEQDEQPAKSSSAKSKRGKAAAAGKTKKGRKLVTIGADEVDASSSDDDDARRDARMTDAADADDDEDDDDEADDATSFFNSNGQKVRTKSGLKPGTVLGLDGLRRTTQSVQDDVLPDEEEEEKKGLKGKGKVKDDKKGKKRKAEDDATSKFDEEGDPIDHMKEAEKLARARLKRTKKNYKAAEKERSDAEKSKKEDFEVVPLQEGRDDEIANIEYLSSDEEAIAERLALGKMMLNKKSRTQLIDDSYNRYAMDTEELAGLPEWFVRDEGQHHAPILPVTKTEVDTYKEQLKAINARPIRKIAEAKARKQVKTAKRWEKLKAQAEVIAAQEGGAGSNEKLKQIEKLFKTKSLKKEKKERVYVVTLRNGKTATPKSSKGRKGKIVKVDARMKKDKRGEKRATQKKSKKKSNKKQKKA